MGGFQNRGGGRHSRELSIKGLGLRVGVYTGVPLCEETATHGSHDSPHSPYFLNSYLTTSKFASFWKMSVFQRSLCLRKKRALFWCTAHPSVRFTVLLFLTAGSHGAYKGLRGVLSSFGQGLSFIFPDWRTPAMFHIQPP